MLLAACSPGEDAAPQVHQTGAPPPAALSPAPSGPVEGVVAQGDRVLIDGDRLFLPGSTELSPQAEPMLRRAAELIGTGDGPPVVVTGRALTPSRPTPWPRARPRPCPTSAGRPSRA
ncbi:hypothetical protein MU852_08870 [Brevundimonas albigilva]|uniref:hypothetical protein n=1 Tax=Brevundimonas albigilva TaxID=1312364 RepID=UPI00201B58B7|nr:hypothetical protein [Brevundimonas albigilva]UQV17101.1 hypothetical protein MU852_08870 [Brevundimonas albigilva]